MLFFKCGTLLSYTSYKQFVGIHFDQQSNENKGYTFSPRYVDRKIVFQPFYFGENIKWIV
jgi:hypothetical protein